MHNIYHEILEEANPHIVGQNEIQPGSTVNIPLISHMYCHKTYLEREVEAPNVMQMQAQAMPS